MAYFFTKNLRGIELNKALLYVIKEVESCGPTVIRVVINSLSVNTTCFKILGANEYIPTIPHSNDVNRKLYLIMLLNVL